MNQFHTDPDAITDLADQPLAQVMLLAFHDTWAARAAADGPVRPRVPAHIGDKLEQLLATGRRAWPDLLAVDGVAFAADFAAHLARQIPIDTADLDAAIATIAAVDLYLAAACMLRLPGAFEA